MTTVALDFDDTYTLDPDLWRQIIGAFKARGWTVLIVSARRPTLENRQEIARALPPHFNIPILLAYDEPKRIYTERMGFSVDVWIDDYPEGI